MVYHLGFSLYPFSLAFYFLFFFCCCCIVVRLFHLNVPICEFFCDAFSLTVVFRSFLWTIFFNLFCIFLICFSFFTFSALFLISCVCVRCGKDNGKFYAKDHHILQMCHENLLGKATDKGRLRMINEEERLYSSRKL